MKQSTNFSKVYSYKGKYFRYNYDEALVSMLSLATPEEILDDAEWQEKHGKSLFNLVNVEGVVYFVWESVGLSTEHWDNKESRDEYLDEWLFDIAEECSYLEEQFIKHELKEV